MKILENEVATFQLASRTRALETLQIEESIRMNLPKDSRQLKRRIDSI